MSLIPHNISFLEPVIQGLHTDNIVQLVNNIPKYDPILHSLSDCNMDYLRLTLGMIIARYLQLVEFEESIPETIGVMYLEAKGNLFSYRLSLQEMINQFNYYIIDNVLEPSINNIVIRHTLTGTQSEILIYKALILISHKFARVEKLIMKPNHTKEIAYYLLREISKALTASIEIILSLEKKLNPEEVRNFLQYCSKGLYKIKISGIGSIIKWEELNIEEYKIFAFLDVLLSIRLSYDLLLIAGYRYSTISILKESIRINHDKLRKECINKLENLKMAWTRCFHENNCTLIDNPSTCLLSGVKRNKDNCSLIDNSWKCLLSDMKRNKCYYEYLISPIISALASVVLYFFCLFLISLFK